MDRRSQIVEEMDRLDSDVAALYATLSHFTLINLALSASRRLIRRHIFRDVTARGAETFSLLDIGSGGGDIPRWIVRRARAAGRTVAVTCIDHDPRVVDYAERANRGYPEITVIRDTAEALHRYGAFDYVFANHFLHHLTDAELLPTLRRIHAATRYRFLVNDLLRSRWSYAGYSALTTLLFRRGFARVDGLRSIAKGFRLEEFVELAAALGPGVEAHGAVPGRVYIVGDARRSPPPTASEESSS